MDARLDNTPKVRAESVPLCLRHGYEGAALSDAKDLVDFIQESIENMFISESSPSSGFKMGLGLCFYLLRDKLAIASGELSFSDADILNKTNAVLWNPECKEAAHADA